MKLLLFLLLVAAVAVIYVMWRKKATEAKTARQEKTATPEDPFKHEAPIGGDPRSIQIGDIVDNAGQSFAVRGSLDVRQGPYRWTEHFFEDTGGTKRWLSVEEDPDVEVVMWRGLPDSELNPDTTVTHAGIQYVCEERGTAQYVSRGTTGLPPKGTVEYADYKAPNNRRLSFERFDGGNWEVSVGEVVPAGLLTIYHPAGGGADM